MDDEGGCFLLGFAFALVLAFVSCGFISEHWEWRSTIVDKGYGHYEVIDSSGNTKFEWGPKTENIKERKNETK